MNDNGEWWKDYAILAVFLQLSVDGCTPEVSEDC